MNANSTIAILIGAFTCTVVNAVEDVPRSIRDYAITHGGPLTLDKHVPPLQLVDVHRWAQILGASEAQTRFMEAEYQRFVERHNAFMDNEGPAYIALSAELTAMRRSDGPSSPSLVDPVRKLDQASLRLRRELTSIEHSLLESIEPILTEAQQERLPILRNESTRRNCRTFYSFARWVGVELREVWEESAAALASPEEISRVETILFEYEDILTALTCRHSDLQFETRQRLLKRRIELSERPRDAEATRADFARSVSSQVDASRNARALTEQTVSRITEALSPAPAAAFVAAAKEAAFPELYPDPTALHELFNAVAADPSLDETGKRNVEDLTQEYQQEYDRINRELEGFCIDWGDRNTQGVNGYQMKFFPSALEPLLKERSELSASYRGRLEEIAGKEAVERALD